MLDFKEIPTYLCDAEFRRNSAWFIGGVSRPTDAKAFGSGLPKTNRENFTETSHCTATFEECSSFLKTLVRTERAGTGTARVSFLYNTLYVPALRSVTVSERHINQREGIVRRLSSDALALYRPFKNSGSTVVSSVPGVKALAISMASESRTLALPIARYTERDQPPPAPGVSSR